MNPVLSESLLQLRFLCELMKRPFEGWTAG